MYWSIITLFMMKLSSSFPPAHFLITFHSDLHPPLFNNPYHKQKSKNTNFPSILIYYIIILLFSHPESLFPILPFYFITIVENLLPSLTSELVYQPLSTPTPLLYKYRFYTYTSLIVHGSDYLVVVIHKVIIMSGMFFFNYNSYYLVLKSIFFVNFTKLFFGLLELFISSKPSSKNALFVFVQHFSKVLLTIKKVHYSIGTRFTTNKLKIYRCPKHKKLYSNLLLKHFINILPKLQISNSSIFQPGYYKRTAKYVNNRHQPYNRGRTKLNFEILVHLLTRHHVSTFSYLCFCGFSYIVILNTCSQYFVYNVVSVTAIFITLFRIDFYIVLATTIGCYLKFSHLCMNVLNTQYFPNIFFNINQLYLIFSLVVYLIMNNILLSKDTFFNLYDVKTGFIVFFDLSNIVVNNNEFPYLFSIFIFLELDSFYFSTVKQTFFIIQQLSYNILRNLSYNKEYRFIVSYLVFYIFLTLTLKMQIISPSPDLRELVYLGIFFYFCIAIYHKVSPIGIND